MKVAIIKYNAGNVRSVMFALERMGVTPILTDVVSEIKSADKVIFPGVGEASSAMKYLNERNLDKLIISLKQPVLGICLGMQLMCKKSEEWNTDCLGIFAGNVKLFGGGMKVPQVGWNTITDFKSMLFSDIRPDSYMYFVHSYYVEKGEYSIATTNYIVDFSSAIQKDNFYAVQFHPEKSSEMGQKILDNFLSL